jgi:hypothetical protein
MQDPASRAMSDFVSFGNGDTGAGARAHGSHSGASPLVPMS